jgi:hypothetical protein
MHTKRCRYRYSSAQTQDFIGAKGRVLFGKMTIIGRSDMCRSLEHGQTSDGRAQGPRRFEYTARRAETR